MSKRPDPRPPVHFAVLTVLGLVACSEHPQDSRQTEYLAAVYANRPQAPAILPASQLLAHRLEVPSRLPQFTLGFPVDLALAPSPRCAVLVADQGDRAIHRFALPSGDYQGSIWFAGRGVTPTSSLSIGVIPDGGVAITHMVAHDLVILDSADRVTRSTTISSLEDSIVAGSQVLPLASGIFAIHWFGTSLPTWSRDWAERSFPVVQLVDSSGTVLASLGEVSTVWGDALPAALNRGYLAKSGDTLWFARASDATILAARIPPAADSGVLVEVSRLPLFYRMRVPMEVVSRTTGLTIPQVESHITAFTVTPDGRYFIVGQSLPK